MSFESEKINVQLAQIRLERERRAFDKELRSESRLLFARKIFFRLFIFLSILLIVGWFFLDGHVSRQNTCQLKQSDLLYQAAEEKFSNDPKLLLKILMLRYTTYPSQRERWTGLRDYFDFHIDIYQSSGLIGPSDIQMLVDHAIKESKGFDACK